MSDEKKIEESRKDVNAKDQSQIIHPISEIKNMEVHHHPQAEKKGFKEYLLEFLMIFLAVTMGFFAENIREYISDKEHVHELSGQLVQGLTNDTLNLQKLISTESGQIKIADRLFALLQQPIAKVDSRELQELVVSFDNIGLFHASLGAISAIKNEMHLKQFTHSRMASCIADYETNLDYLKANENIVLEYLKKYMETFMALHFTPANIHAFVNGNAITNSELRNTTQDDLIQLNVNVQLITAFNSVLITYYKRQKDKAVDFIQYVNKEYHLEQQ